VSTFFSIAPGQRCVRVRVRVRVTYSLGQSTLFHKLNSAIGKLPSTFRKLPEASELGPYVTRIFTLWPGFLSSWSNYRRSRCPRFSARSIRNCGSTDLRI